MPKKNQQNKPSGFVLFANEIKNQLLKEGHEIRNMPDLIAAASPKWQILADNEKEYYKEKAKWEWENRNITGKFQPKKPKNKSQFLNERVDSVRWNQIKREKERQEVFMSFPPVRGVLEQKFYFVSFICLLEQPMYQVLEVSAAEFSLLNGIEATMHKHVNPGPIPMGYRFTAEQRSQMYHKLPLEGKMDPGDTYTKIYDELFSFLSRGTRHIPPIFVKMSECEHVEGCLKWLAENAGRPHQLKRIYELEGLMLDLDAHLRGEPQNFMQFKQPATKILTSNYFDWELNTRCAFHEDEANETESIHCALGIVNRYGYCISDYFCKNHNIPITERHLPPSNDEVSYTIIPSRDEIKTSRHAKHLQRQQQRTRTSAPHIPAPETGEDIANLVAERLKLEQDQEDQYQQQQMKEEKLEKQHAEEQKKRWMAIRGSPSRPNEQQHHNQQQQQQQPQQQPQPQNTHRAIARGRGRGVIASNLRRPGEKHTENKLPTIGNQQTQSAYGVAAPPGFTQFPSFGRGIRVQEAGTGVDESETYVAPHPSEAPKPPTTWMT